MNSVPVTVGICAYNEEGNIERSIRSVYEQKTETAEIKEVIVISSGSTDRTDEIVRSLLPEYRNLRFIPQEKREGKNSAVNLLLDSKNTEIIVLLNADNVLGDGKTLDYLISPFLDSKVGIAGGRPVPTNPKNTFVGFASNFLWTMHHYVAVRYPKIGELIAFRDIGTRLSENTQSDEDTLRMELEKKGYTGVYVPEAVIYNRGPETVRDFVKQRTRVNIGERYMKKDYDYDIPSWDKSLLVGAFADSVKELGFRPAKIMFAASLEICSRLRAVGYVHADRGDMNVWDQVSSTKKL
ncbi:MAG: glycosyltransferase [Candidatus Methanomethylophilaceae archaeon]|jgi:biofilm PGA synthesis N-glycosyltransferase PgaC